MRTVAIAPAIGNAQVSHLHPGAIGGGGKIFRMFGEVLAGQQLLDHVTAVFNVDAALAMEPFNLFDSIARIERVADVEKRIDSVARHPRDELPVMRQVQRKRLAAPRNARS